MLTASRCGKFEITYKLDVFLYFFSLIFIHLQNINDTKLSVTPSIKALKNLKSMLCQHITSTKKICTEIFEKTVSLICAILIQIFENKFDSDIFCWH